MNCFIRTKKLIEITIVIATGLAASQTIVFCRPAEKKASDALPVAGNGQTTSAIPALDQQIARQVNDALKSVGVEAPIRVEVTHGIVALKGEVKSLADRLHIIEAAESVRGVEAVVPFIDVNPPTRPDALIEKDVFAALKNNVSTRKIDPVVSVQQGVVTLAGTGSEWQVKHRAKYIAEQVPGVREVLDPMCFPYEGTTNDSIKETITTAFARSQPALNNISIEVNSGRVVLNGQVKSMSDKLRAITRAYITGVRSVDGHELQVDSAANSQTTPSDNDISKAIEIAFAHNPTLMSSSLHVSVEKGTAKLTGEVSNLKARSTAGLLAAEMPCVQKVQNDLLIKTEPQRTDQELVDALRTAYSYDLSVNLHQVQVSVDHGHLLLSGSVNTPHEKWSAEDIARNIGGIVMINNQLDVTHTPEPVVISNPIIRPWEFAELWWTIPMPTLKTDGSLEADVKNQLYWSPLGNARTITVTVDAGVVTLTGNALSAAEKKAAEDGAYRAGALQVQNHLEVVSNNPTIAAGS